MSPYGMKLLLDIYCTSEDPKECPTLNDTLAKFSKDGLIQPRDFNKEGGTLKITPLGEAFIKSALNTPIPRQVYIDSHGDIIE